MTHQIDTNDLTYLEKRYGKIKGWVPGAVNEKTGAINPQVTMAVLPDGKYASVFHVKPVYYETSTGHWRPLSEVTTHHGNRRIEFNADWWKVHPRYMAWLEKRVRIINGQLLIPSVFGAPSPYSGIVRELHESLVPIKIGLTTSTFYPDPNTETTTVDGNIQHGNAVWATVRAAATGTTADDSNANLFYQTSSSSGQYYIRRVYTLFDTSSIDDTDTIDSATYSLYVTTGINASSFSIVACTATPASNTAIGTGDYDIAKFGSTSFGSFSIPTTGLNNYFDIALNASGLAAISKTGVSFLGNRVSGDFNNTAPASGETYNQGAINSADTSGTSTDPKLVVVHTPASTLTPRVSFIM